MNATQETVKPKPSGRPDRRPRDMVLSLAVLLVPIGVIFLVWGFLTSETPVSEIDPTPAYIQAEGLGLDVTEPEGLSQEWRPLSSGVNQADGLVTLRVGYYTPSGGGMQFIASQVDSAELIEAELNQSPRLLGPVTVGDVTWQSYVTAKGTTALVYTDESMTLIVHGDTTVEELQEFAMVLG
ncbi:DUF4245 domain-containing protein [Stackebrandtia endophytica]|nr:DUF4245 domain-containing protein [Stackebrandtia endophytica]